MRTTTIDNVECLQHFRRVTFLVILCAYIFIAGSVLGAPEKEIPADARCSVCGMFVAKYENWIVQVRLEDNSILYFDGAKDMLVYYFNPSKYGGANQQEVREIWVKDYYTLQWLDGFSAFYVVGSDVFGPMGKEFIPFSSKDAADSFLKDHKGTKVLRFDEITDDLVQSMRTTKMRHDKQ